MYRILKNDVLKRMLSLFLLFNLFFGDIIYAANIVVGSGETTVDKAANGTDMVNIANPNEKGISHNDFESYNVDSKGLILNNSKEVGRTQLGGYVNGNPNLTNSARLIISEVSGSSRSNIEGYTEVFGRSADFILSNPNGIYLNGAGFINVPNVTLTTGRVTDINGDIHFNVQNGNIEIGLQGIDLRNTNYFEIISRTASLYGNIYGGKEVDIITGTNDYDYQNKTYEALENGSEKPEIAIDTSELGGIYAGRIKMISTENGVGINSKSEISADIADITIDANGNVVLGSLYAVGNVNIENKGNTSVEGIGSEENIYVDNTGILKSNGMNANNIVINTEDVLNTGNIKASEKIKIDSENKVVNKGILLSKDVEVISKELNSAGKIKANEKLELSIEESIENKGMIASKQVDLSTKKLINTGSVYANESIRIDVDNSVVNKGTLLSKDVEITSEELNNEGEIEANEKLELSIEESIENKGMIASKQVDLSTKKFINTGNVYANESIRIDVDNSVVNKGTLLSKDVEITSEELNNEGEIEANEKLELSIEESIENKGMIASKQVDLSTKKLINTGNVYANEAIKIDVDNLVVNKGTLFAKNVEITSKELNSDGEIKANEKLELSIEESIENKGMLASKQIDLSTKKLVNAGSIKANESIKIDSKDEIENTGLQISKEIDISTDKMLNKGKIIGENLVEVEAKTFENEGEVISYNKTKIDSELLKNKENGIIGGEEELIINSDALINDGIITGNSSVEIKVKNNLDNNNKIFSKKVLLVQAPVVNTKGDIIALESVEINADNFNILKGAVGGAKGEINVAEKLYVSNDGSITTNEGDIIGNIIVIDGLIKTKNLNLKSKDLQNNNDIIAFENMNLYAEKIDNNGRITGLDSLEIVALDKLNNKTYGVLYSKGSVSINADGIRGELTNNGKINGVTSVVINNSSVENNNLISSGLGGTDINSNEFKNNVGASLVSSGNIDLKEETMINSGDISGNMVEVLSKSVENTGTVNTVENLHIGADNITNSTVAKIIAGTNVEFDGNIINRGEIYQLSDGGYIKFSSNAVVENTGIIGSNGDINALETSSFSNKNMLASENGKIEIKNLNNQNGNIKAKNNVIVINNGVLNNIDGEIVSESAKVEVNASTLDNTRGKLLSNDEVDLNFVNGFNAVGTIKGVNNTKIKATSIGINTALESKNIEVEARSGDVAVNNRVYGTDTVKITSDNGNITNNNSIQSSGGNSKIEMKAKASIVNNGMIASNNFLELKSNVIKNSATLFAKKTLTLKADNNVMNDKGVILSSEGDINILGNNRASVSYFINNVGAVEAGNNIVIKADNVSNTGEVVGEPTIVKKRVGEPELNKTIVVERLEADNSNYRVNLAKIKSNNNIFIEAENLTNNGGIISAKNDIGIKANIISNITPSYKKWFEHYEYSCRVYMKEYRIGPFKYKNKKKYDWNWTPGILEVETKDKAQISAGNNLSISGTQVGNGQKSQHTYVAGDSYTNRVNVTTASIEDIKNSRTIDMADNIEIPEGKFDLFKLNSDFDDKAIELSNKKFVIGGKVDKFDMDFDDKAIELSDKKFVIGGKVDKFDVDFGNEDIELKKIERREPNYNYLVETNIEFIDLSRYYGSSYFFKKINYNPEKDVNINLIGDSYYETKLVTDSIQNKIGRQYLSDGIYSDNDQMKSLYDNAAVAMKDLNLEIGIELTKEQINSLNKDIVWLVEKEVQGHNVLVPQVYLAQNTLDNLSLDGSIIRAKNDLKIDANVVDNSGAIVGGNSVAIEAGTINNITVNDIKAKIKGGNVSLVAENDIINIGADIEAYESVDIFAGRDAVFDTIENISEINSNNYTSKKVVNTKSSVTGKDINISAGNDVLLRGTDVASTQDTNISAGNNVTLEAVKDSEYEKSITKSKSFMSSKKTTKEHYDETIVGTNVLAGGDINISAGNDIALIGSNVASEKDDGDKKNIKLKAGNDAYAVDIKENDYDYSKTEKKGFSVSFDGGTFKAGIEKTTTTTMDMSSVGTKTEITGDNISVEAGNKFVVKGSEISADNEVDIDAKNGIEIIESKDTYVSESVEEKQFTGITASVNLEMLNLKDNLEQIKGLAEGLRGNRSDMINSLSGAVTGARGTAGAVNEIPDYSGQGVTNNGTNNMKAKMDYKDAVSLSFGVEKSKTESKSYNEDAIASVISGKKVNMNSDNGDVLVRGSEVSGEDISISGENVVIASAKEQGTNSSRTTRENASVGVNGAGGISASAGGGRDKTNGSSEKNVNAQINAEGNLKITTENDMLVAGANIKADTIDMNIGNNLVVESVQDKELSKSDSKSGSLTVGTSVSGSFNTRNDKLDKKWVNDQTSIVAANGGNIKVGNNTQLKGAVIASENSDKNINLDTKSISSEDMSDDDEGESKGFGISGGMNSVPGISVVYGNHDKEQINRGTLSNVDLVVDGKETSAKELGINDDISKAQEITKDEKLDTIDADLHTDLLNKSERDKLVDAKDKVGDFVNAVVDNDGGKGFTNTLKNNRFSSKGARAVERDPELLKALNSIDENTSAETKRNILQEVVDTFYKANGFDMQNAPKVTLYDGTTEEGFHDIDNVDRVNEVFINVNSITEMLSGENADIGEAIALAIHETTHINQVDTKDDLAEMKASGKNSAEENLAEHVEGRISDKIDTDSDKFTEEEMKEYLAGLEVKNKEKGRDQKSLAEGTVEAEKVGSESKEKIVGGIFDFLFTAEPLGVPGDELYFNTETGEYEHVFFNSDDYEYHPIRDAVVGAAIGYPLGKATGYVLGKGYKVLNGAFAKEITSETLEVAGKVVDDITIFNIGDDVLKEGSEKYVKAGSQAVEGTSKGSKWWHAGYVDNLNGTNIILGVKQSAEGLSTLGSTSRSTAMTTGLDWVGEGAKKITDKSGNIIGYKSTDGMKAFRIQFKSSEKMWRANFTENIKVMTQGGETIKELKNVHIDILD